MSRAPKKSNLSSILMMADLSSQVNGELKRLLVGSGRQAIFELDLALNKAIGCLPAQVKDIVSLIDFKTSDINKRFVDLEMSIKTVSRIHTPQLEDIPELIHRIQSLLPAKEAARTCILSKSWLHAWSTIPTLRFTTQFQKFVTDEQKIKYQKVIDHTLQ
nr:hypothetical protein [Tanacetum cinerariifolium]